MTVFTLVQELKSADRKRKQPETIHEGQAEFMAVVVELLAEVDSGLLTPKEFLEITSPYRGV